MNTDFTLKNCLRSAGHGITAAMLIGSYTLCVCAATGLGSLSALLCVWLCTLFSVGTKNKIFAPDSFLLVPVLFIIGSANFPTLIVSVFAGSIIFLILRKCLPGLKIPDSVFAGGGLALAFVATVLLTNLYFGIGSTGATAFDMLKSYRSLGFHPNFRGLLYGTVTLFAMITYPFKFRRLNKYLPAEFMTLLIPLIMNLFLNPVAELTTINEITNFRETDFKLFELSSVGDISLPVLFRGSVSVALLLFAYCNQKEDSPNFAFANTFNGLLTGIPLREHSIIKYDIISALTCFVLSSAVILLFPDLLQRIPMHCVGAMLIVSAWQSVPYKKLVAAFRENALSALFCIALIFCVFLFKNVFYGVLMCFIITFVQEQKNGKR